MSTGLMLADAPPMLTRSPPKDAVATTSADAANRFLGRAGASIRFGLGRTTTPADVDFAIDRVATVVAALRREVTSA